MPSAVVRHRHSRGSRPTREGSVGRRRTSAHPQIFAGAHMMKRLSEIPWKTVSTKPIYQNRWLSLREDLVELPNGRTTIYGVVSCGECVGVLPFREVLELVLSGEIVDSMTIIAVLRAARIKGM